MHVKKKADFHVRQKSKYMKIENYSEGRFSAPVGHKGEIVWTGTLCMHIGGGFVR
jgi:hypothetical protein